MYALCVQKLTVLDNESEKRSCTTGPRILEKKSENTQATRML